MSKARIEGGPKTHRDVGLRNGSVVSRVCN